jgi:hypothetical protein
MAQSAPPTLGQAALDAPGDGVHISFATRERYETIENTPRTGYAPSESWWSLRSNLAASWQSGPIRIAAELTDSRVYGAHAGSVVTSNDVNAFEPTQAYISANLGAVLGRGGGMKVTAGRMALNLGSRRLVAADDYRNAANNYTGLRVDGTLAGGYAATAIYMLPVARLADDPYGVADNRVELDKESLSTILWGGLVNHGVKDGVLSEASFYHFRERDWPGHATRDRDLDTAGLRFYRAPHAGRIDGEVEAMYQWGQERASTLPTAALLDVSATFFHAHIGYSFPHGWHPRVALEFDRASGDGPGATYGRFDTLYGMRRGFLAAGALCGGGAGQHRLARAQAGGGAEQAERCAVHLAADVAGRLARQLFKHQRPGFHRTFGRLCRASVRFARPSLADPAPCARRMGRADPGQGAVPDECTQCPQGWGHRVHLAVADVCYLGCRDPAGCAARRRWP